jgi:hypothetical protein
MMRKGEVRRVKGEKLLGKHCWARSPILRWARSPDRCPPAPRSGDLRRTIDFPRLPSTTDEVIL